MRELFKQPLFRKLVLLTACLILVTLSVHFVLLLRYLDRTPVAAALEAFIMTPLRVLLLYVLLIFFFGYVHPRIRGSK